MKQPWRYLVGVVAFFCVTSSSMVHAQESPDSVIDEVQSTAPVPLQNLEIKSTQDSQSLPLGSPARPSVMSPPPVNTENSLESLVPKTVEGEGAEVISKLSAQPKTQLFRSAKLRAINKVTARYATLDAPLGMLVRFGNLEIIAQRCQTDELVQGSRQETALVDIWELKPNEKPARIFHGWIFANSPSLSNVNHAVYDVGLVSCKDSETPPE